MDQKLKDEWASALESLMDMCPDRRRHFAMLLINLAKCYIDKDHWKAVIIIDNSNELLTFSAGATEFEAAEMLQLANDVVTMAATADAPEREMYN